jgi:hypothetical protein
MPFNRLSSRAALVLLVLLLAAPSFGQGPEGLQIFAPADVSTMGGDIQPNEGWFFQFDGLYWTISQPNVAPLGFPGLTRNVALGVFDNDIRTDSNTIDTSIFTNQFSPGDRFEFGRVEDRNGWMMTIYQLRDQEQDVVVPQGTITFQDQPFGPFGEQHLEGLIDPLPNGLFPLPVVISNVAINHSVDTWGVELMYLHQFRACHEGSMFEFFAGPRYLEFNDRFGVTIGAATTATTVPDFLAGSSWTNSAMNHVIGGEIGTRWSKKRGRWMLNAEGRFLAGMNQQNIHQQVNFGPLLNPGIVSTVHNAAGQPITEFGSARWFPWLMGGTTNTYDASPQVWCPGIELRLEARYQITSAVSFHAGWTGLWLGGIARGDATIDYTLHSDGTVFGIDTTRNRESLFMNGLTLGFDVNR